MKFTRHFTSPHLPIQDQIKWKLAESKITKSNGEIVFEMTNIEVPSHWSQQAINILAQKYFRKAGVPKETTLKFTDDPQLPPWLVPHIPTTHTTFGSETSAKQVFHRLAGTWTYWGWKEGIFKHDNTFSTSGFLPEENARIFYDEIYYSLAHQHAAPNSPQWFNTGLNWAYGITGDASGQWICDENGPRETSDSYTNPQPHACFIQPISDNLVEDGGIYDLLKKEALLFKHGSGTGTNFSNIRGKDEKLGGGGRSSGLMSFLKVLDTSAGAISSGGTTRRAAKMVCLDLDHPEIEDFVNWKLNEERKAASLYLGSEVINQYLGQGTFVDDLTPQSIIDRVANGFDTLPFDLEFEGEAINTVSAQNANNSVRITDQFLYYIDNNKSWNLISRKSKSITKIIQAKDLWNQITRAAWACGDPGLQFHDTINQWHTCKNDGDINASNPCSEYMFLDDTACNLASLNLGKFLKNSQFRTDDFIYATRLWTIVLEISVYMASFPSKEIAQNSYAYRTLGLGYMNLGGLLMRSSFSYDSNDGRNLAAQITALMHGVSYLTSQEIAKELGPFLRWESNKEPMSQVIQKHKDSLLQLKFVDAIRFGTIIEKNVEIWNQISPTQPFRNAQVTLLAPTGTIHLLTDCDTSGIEPDFSLIKYKNLSGGGVIQIVNECIPEALKNLGYTSAQIFSMTQHIKDHGNLEDYVINDRHLPEEHLKVFDCANPSGNGTRYLSPMSHVLMMAAVQPFLSGAISKTCNLPNSATIQDVDHIYREAHRLGLKAIAIYRDGSKLTQPLSSKKEKPLNLGKEQDELYIDFITETLDPKLYLDKNNNHVSKEELPKLEQQVMNELLRRRDEHFLNSPDISIPLNSLPFETQPSAKELPFSSRHHLPMRRKGYTQKVRIDGQSVYLRTGEYSDGKLGEFTLDISREGSTVRALLGGFSKLASISLQFGVPLSKLVDAFIYTKFEPSGIVEGHDQIKLTTSILDFVFRELAIHYLNQSEFANVTQEEEKPKEHQTYTPIYLGLDSFTIPLHEKTLETEFVAYSPQSNPKPSGNLCPNCGHNTLIQTGTCVTCTTCGNNSGCG